MTGLKLDSQLNLEPKMMHNKLLGACSAKLNLCPVRAFNSLLTMATLYHAIMEELHADDPLCNKLENWEGTLNH